VYICSKMQRFFLIFILLFGISLALKGQFRYYAGLSTSFGTIAAHHSEMKYLITEPSYCLNAELLLPANPNKIWSYQWRGARSGIGLFAGDLGNNKLAGNAISLFGFVETPFVKTKQHQIHYRMGGGLAYLTSAFNTENNYHQIAIGTHLNAHIHFSIAYRYSFDKIPLSMDAGFNFDHFSNGGMSKPNLGFNLLSFKYSLLYKFGIEAAESNIPDLNFTPEKKLNFHINSGFALYKNFVYDPNYYLISNIQLAATYRFNYKRSWGLGTDMIYDTSIPDFYEDEEHNRTKDKLRSGIFICQHLHYGDRFIFFMQLGFYLHNPKHIDGFVYERLGVRVVLFDSLNAGIAVKAHAAVANGVELTLGYTF
jgi:hypothetical protein